MKVSLNWIKDYVDLPQDMDLTRLAYDLTMSTVEVEGAEDLARRFDHMLVGRIVEVCPHPNADKLQICRTDIGGGDIRDIVCGGTNVRPDMKVAVAAPGAMCRWHGEGEPVEIKEAKLRGVKSYGMICGAAEIGLGDLFPTTEEAHILDLSDFDAAAGTPIADALDLHDIILEIDNKSMTNRPDLWGHYGIARELAALYDLPLKQLPPFTCDAGADGLTVTVEDTERCPRYIGAAVEGLSVKPAPFRMQSRIWRVGMRPINALVDITNYVMLATGQPTHAFDSDNIAGHIIVRRAKDGEQLELLNGKALSLSADDLVIADEAGVVGLAGVMGGAKDSVLPSTDKVILEIANFQAAGVRRTALRYDNRTEASSRYEKGIDPERCDQALSLAMSLFRELYPGTGSWPGTGPGHEPVPGAVSRRARHQLLRPVSRKAAPGGDRCVPDLAGPPPGQAPDQRRDRPQAGPAGLPAGLQRRQHARYRAHLALHRRCIHQGRHHGGGSPDGGL